MSSAEPNAGARFRGQYSFGDFTLDVDRRVLRRRGEEVTLRSKSFEVLAYVVDHHGQLVTKAALMDAVWPDTAVTDNSLAQCMVDIRRALDDNSQQLIRTVARRGYVFTAPVTMPVVEFPYQGPISTSEPGPLTATPSDPGKIQDARTGFRLRRGPVFAAIAGSLIIGLAWFLSFRRVRPLQSNQIRAIAVLPLENLSGDPAQDYFADGMTEAIIGRLARIRAVRVISRPSIMHYKGTHKPLREIAHELNVDGVIAGTVQRSGGRLRVTAQLIHAATDAHLWAREYDRDLTDVLSLESDIAGAVAEEIRVQVTAEERARLASAQRVDPQAHDAYLVGRYYFSKRNQRDLTRAIDSFERATQADPNYAAAYTGLSDAWLQRGVSGVNLFKEVEAPARTAALTAIRLDEQLAEAHVSLGNIKEFYDWDWAGAEREFRRALELDPGSLNTHLYYGVLLMHLERHDEAIREGQIAAKLDPVSSRTQSTLGRFYYRARRYEEALPYLKRAVELEPRNAEANVRLGENYAQMGRYDEAIAALERNRDLTSERGDLQAGIARVHALMGRHREARQMIRGLRANAAVLARVYAALGDHDQAFRMLEKAVEERSTAVTYLKADPPFQKMHSDPRWKVLLRRMNLTAE